MSSKALIIDLSQRKLTELPLTGVTLPLPDYVPYSAVGKAVGLLWYLMPKAVSPLEEDNVVIFAPCGEKTGVVYCLAISPLGFAVVENIFGNEEYQAMRQAGMPIFAIVGKSDLPCSIVLENGTAVITSDTQGDPLMATDLAYKECYFSEVVSSSGMSHGGLGAVFAAKNLLSICHEGSSRRSSDCLDKTALANLDKQLAILKARGIIKKDIGSSRSLVQHGITRLADDCRKGSRYMAYKYSVDSFDARGFELCKQEVDSPTDCFFRHDYPVRLLACYRSVILPEKPKCSRLAKRVVDLERKAYYLLTRGIDVSRLSPDQAKSSLDIEIESTAKKESDWIVETLMTVNNIYGVRDTDDALPQSLIDPSTLKKLVKCYYRQRGMSKTGETKRYRDINK